MSITPNETILLVGHGSREAGANEEIEAFAEQWRQRQPGWRIEVLPTGSVAAPPQATPLALGQLRPSHEAPHAIATTTGWAAQVDRHGDTFDAFTAQGHLTLRWLDPLQQRQDSAAHAGHAGAASGGGHFELTLVSPVFAGVNAVARHRLVYQALGDLIPSRIHALSLRAYAPGEL